MPCQRERKRTGLTKQAKATPSHSCLGFLHIHSPRCCRRGCSWGGSTTARAAGGAAGSRLLSMMPWDMSCSRDAALHFFPQRGCSWGGSMGSRAPGGRRCWSGQGCNANSQAVLRKSDPTAVPLIGFRGWACSGVLSGAAAAGAGVWAVAGSAGGAAGAAAGGHGHCHVGSGRLRGGGGGQVGVVLSGCW